MSQQSNIQNAIKKIRAQVSYIQSSIFCNQNTRDIPCDLENFRTSASLI